ncbi:MAG: hypothetical protein ACKOQM_11170 [Novosphingobium sp.]
MDPKTLQTVLPIAIILIVFALRFRNLNKPRPFNAGRLWIAPALITLVAATFLLASPPDTTGWAIIMVGAALGLGAGLLRGKWMHLERDPATGNLLIRQSPLALLFLVGIMIARRGLSYELGAGGADTSGHLTATTLWVTEGLLGFALAMVVAMRWTLWQRSKEVPPHPEVFS